MNNDIDWTEKQKQWEILMELLPFNIKELRKDKIEFLGKKIESEKISQTRLKKLNKIINS